MSFAEGRSLRWHPLLFPRSWILPWYLFNCIFMNTNSGGEYLTMKHGLLAKSFKSFLVYVNQSIAHLYLVLVKTWEEGEMEQKLDKARSSLVVLFYAFHGVCIQTVRKSLPSPSDEPACPGRAPNSIRQHSPHQKFGVCCCSCFVLFCLLLLFGFLLFFFLLAI